jgi:succinate dehydrogenase/fumarate reductase cytochrome b subunit
MQTIARTSALLLLLGVIVLIVTGWGITQTGAIFNFSHGLIDRRSADLIHRATNFPLTLFFLVHIFSNIKVALYKSRPGENWLINGLMIGLACAALAVVAYMEYFRRGG